MERDLNLWRSVSVRLTGARFRFATKEAMMPRGDKSSYSDKQKRIAEHIEEGYEDRGVGAKEAERRAWATVNKETHGGKKSGSGRGKKRSLVSSVGFRARGGAYAQETRGPLTATAKRNGNGSVHHDGGATHSFALHQTEQYRGVAGVEPYAAVRRRAAEARDLVGAMDGKTAVKEDRVRHRRIVVFAREPAPRHHLRMIGAARRSETGPAGRNPPAVARFAVDDDRHGLAGTVDIDDDGCLGAPWRGDKDQKQCGYGADIT
jgi:hypothetical protein